MDKDLSNQGSSFFYEHDPVIKELSRLGVLKALAYIDDISQMSENEKCVIVYSPLSVFLSEIIRNNKDLSSSLKEWQENISNILQATSSSRSNTVLISSSDVVDNLSSYEVFCGVKIESLPDQPVLPFSELVATYLISKHRDIKRLVDQLEAMTTPLSENSAKKAMSIEDVSALCVEQQHIFNALTQAETTIQNLSLEIKDLDSALVAVNVALTDEQQFNKTSKVIISDYRLKVQGINAELETSEFERRKYRRQRDKSDRRMKELSEEIVILRSMLNTRDEQIENFRAEIESLKRSLNSELVDLERENSELLSELTLLRRENDKMKTGAFYNANKIFQKVKRKLVRQSGVKVDEQEIAIIATSDFFNISWYLKTNPDVADSELHPVEHYLLYGYKEGRLPSPDFDGDWYLKQYPDVAKSGINPLLHFEMYGRTEGRMPSLKMISSKNS